MTTIAQEQTTNRRLDLMNSLLTTPHRQLSKVQPVHKQLLDEDPLFYAHLASWYVDGNGGEIRDHKELFLANLITHEDQTFREAGLAMLREMPPYQVTRITDFIHGKEGLNKNPPNSLVTEVKNYLAEREKDPDWFDSTVLTNRKGMKRLYALLHIKPGERAQSILFDNKPPEGSRLADLKDLFKISDPSKQGKLIVEKKIPYKVAVSVLKNMTPTALLACIEVMSPQELINSMNSLRKRGVFDNPDLKRAVEEKLKKAQKGKNVTALKAIKAAEVAGLSEDLNKSLQDVADKQLKSRGQITRPTALLIDKSYSMNEAIELSKQLGSLISSVMAEGVPLYCYAFDVVVYPIKAAGPSLTDWQNALKYIRATGGTGCGLPLVQMAKQKEYVEQIVLVTDEGENQPPCFNKAYREYCEALNVNPSVCIIRCGTFTDNICLDLQKAGVDVSKYDITSQSDYYSLPGIVQYLTRPSKLELLMDIMNYPLPQRKSA